MTRILAKAFYSLVFFPALC